MGKYNDLAHKYNALESTKLSQIKVHRFPDEIPNIPKDDTCVSLYLFTDNESDEPPCNLNDSSLWYQFEIDKAFSQGNNPCYFIYASDVLDAINKAVNARRIAGPEPCKTYEDGGQRDGVHKELMENEQK